MLETLLPKEFNELSHDLDKNPGSERLNRIVQNADCRAFFKAYQNFEEPIHAGKLWPPTQVWISFKGAALIILIFKKQRNALIWGFR